MTAASAASGSQLGHPAEPRLLAFHFTKLSFEARPPSGAHVVSTATDDALEEVLRAYRRTYSSTEPYADGWAAPELRLTRPRPGAARLVCLTGVHETPSPARRDRSGYGPLSTAGRSVWVSFTRLAHSRCAGRCQPTWSWACPRSEQKDRAADRCEVIVTSGTSIVPSRFWPSDDVRSLAFRFVDLTFESKPPQGAMVVRQTPALRSNVRALAVRAGRIVSRILRPSR